MYQLHLFLFSLLFFFIVFKSIIPDLSSLSTQLIRSSYFSFFLQRRRKVIRSYTHFCNNGYITFNYAFVSYPSIYNVHIYLGIWNKTRNRHQKFILTALPLPLSYSRTRKHHSYETLFINLPSKIRRKYRTRCESLT